MARAAATGARLMAASATLALSTRRQAIISATSASMGPHWAAKLAMCQASWSSRARLAAEGCTLTSIVCMAKRSVLRKKLSPTGDRKRSGGAAQPLDQRGQAQEQHGQQHHG